MKQTLTDKRGETDRNTVIAVGFNTPLTSIDTFSRQKINKETVALNDTLDQMDLIDIFRAFHTKEYTYFSKCIWNVFKERPHVGTHRSQ